MTVVGSWRHRWPGQRHGIGIRGTPRRGPTARCLFRLVPSNCDRRVLRTCFPSSRRRIVRCKVRMRPYGAVESVVGVRVVLPLVRPVETLICASRAINHLAFTPSVARLPRAEVPHVYRAIGHLRPFSERHGSIARSCCGSGRFFRCPSIV